MRWVILFATALLLGEQRLLCSRPDRIDRECRTVLKSIVTAELAWFYERGEFTTRWDDVSFVLERGNRYAYFLDGARAARDVDPLKGRSFPVARLRARSELGVSVGCPKAGVTAGPPPGCFLTAACGREVPGGAVEVWSISTALRVTAAGDIIPAGVPFRETPPVLEWRL